MGWGLERINIYVWMENEWKERDEKEKDEGIHSSVWERDTMHSNFKLEIGKEKKNEFFIDIARGGAAFKKIISRFTDFPYQTKIKKKNFVKAKLF